MPIPIAPQQRPVRTVCVEKRWTHHADVSGYDRLGDFLDAERVRRVQVTSGLTKFLWAHVSGRRAYLSDHHLADRFSEEKAFWTAVKYRADIVHVLYGDEQLRVLLRRERLMPGHLVATFHLPAARTQARFERVPAKQLSRLSGAIVVASAEVPAAAAWLGADKVMYVPHGIDTLAFAVGPGNPERPLRLLFVGEHMRDFDVAHRVFDRCAREQVDVIFDVVIPARRNDAFTGCDNIVRHNHITDEQLIRLYQHSDALFLPVTGATANNSVLEALACGLPVISTLVGGLPDYVNETCGWLLPPRDAEAAFACVKALAETPSRARDKRRAARAQAERFSWVFVAAQIQAGYRRLLDGKAFAL